MSYDVTDSPLVHPREPLTVADQIAFDAFTDEQKRVARVVLKEEITEQVYDDLNVESTKDKLDDAREKVAKLTDALEYLRGEGIERIYKNSKGFWLYAKDEKGKITYDPHESTGPYSTLEKAIQAGTK